MLSILGGRRGESRNFREKGKTFQKIGGERTKHLYQEKVTCKQLGLGVFYCSFVLLSQCTNKVIDGFHAVIRSLNVIVSLLLVQVAT